MVKTRKNNAAMRKTRKQTRGKRPLSDWNKKVKKVYEEMKRRDNSIMFKDALKEAAKRKKAGNL